jgi:hypothetical protein
VGDDEQGRALQGTCRPGGMNQIALVSRRDVKVGRGRSVDHPVTLGSSSILRTQAAFHSALLICVSRSQNPMQSASNLPPPPGVLGADALGLAEEEASGDRAMFGCTVPPVAN